MEEPPLKRFPSYLEDSSCTYSLVSQTSKRTCSFVQDFYRELLKFNKFPQYLPLALLRIIFLLFPILFLLSTKISRYNMLTFKSFLLFLLLLSTCLYAFQTLNLYFAYKKFSKVALYTTFSWKYMAHITILGLNTSLFTYSLLYTRILSPFLTCSSPCSSSCTSPTLEALSCLLEKENTITLLYLIITLFLLATDV